MNNDSKLIVQDKSSFDKQFSKSSFDVEEIDSFDCSAGDIVLFTGSIIDKSEIAYRQLTNSVGQYFTIIPDSMDESNVDIFWKTNSIVIKESFANEVLSHEKLESFMNILKSIENFVSMDVEKYLQSNTSQYTDFNQYRPVNMPEYKAEDSFLGELASGFRSASKLETIYKLKYTPKDKKGTKAVIARFSTKSDDESCRLLSIANINSEEELIAFYAQNREEIESFMISDQKETVITFENQEVVLTNISNEIGNSIYVVVSYDDKKAMALFEDDKLVDIAGINDFFLIKNYATQNIMPSSLVTYKKFINSIKAFDFSEKFQDDFARIVNTSKNAFLIQQLKNLPNASAEMLQMFYSYLLDKKGNEQEPQNQLSSLLRVIDTTQDLDSLPEKFIINFYFYIRNTILKNNKEFLQQFDEYQEQTKLNLDILEEIEECIGTVDYEDIDSEIVHETRSYNLNYLDYLKSKMREQGCLKYLDKVAEIISDINAHEIEYEELSTYDKPTSLSQELSSGETLVIRESLSQRVAEHLTYIHKFLTAPTQLETEMANKLDEQLILDLLTMWSIQSIANEETTLSMAKSFIQKNYLSGVASEEKLQWRSAVCNVIYKLYKKHIEYDKFSNLIQTINLEEFDTDLVTGFNLEKENKHSFISKVSYSLEDFISTKASGDKFNKFFKTKNDVYIVAIIEKLFGKDRTLVHLLDAGTKEITDKDEFIDIKQLLCKGRVSQSKGADELCLKFFKGIKNV